MQRRTLSPRPFATARAARAGAPAFVVSVRVALLALVAVAILVLTPALARAATSQAGDSAANAPAATVAPSPQLTPGEVVAIVLAALSRNDSPVKDHGVSVTFAFTSPANRAFVGPLESFADLVREDAYRPLLNHRSAARGDAHVNGDRATVRVVVTTAAGARVAYVFALSMQNDGPYKGCWMTDGVTREPPSPLQGIRFAD
jgi:hypothetical protein